jgi:hypothetical protein
MKDDLDPRWGCWRRSTRGEPHPREGRTGPSSEVRGHEELAFSGNELGDFDKPALIGPLTDKSRRSRSGAGVTSRQATVGL